MRLPAGTSKSHLQKKVTETLELMNLERFADAIIGGGGIAKCVSVVLYVPLP